MAQTNVLATQGLTAIPGERTHHGFEGLRPIGPVATRTYSHIEPRPIVPALGAEISGIDLRQPSVEAQKELREALVTYSAKALLCFAIRTSRHINTRSF